MQGQFVSQQYLLWWQGFPVFRQVMEGVRLVRLALWRFLLPARQRLLQVCPISAGLVARDVQLAEERLGKEHAEAVLSGNEAIGR